MQLFIIIDGILRSVLLEASSIALFAVSETSVLVEKLFQWWFKSTQTRCLLVQLLNFLTFMGGMHCFSYWEKNIFLYYSTNCNTIQIWSWCSRYLSSVGNRYPAICVTSYVGRKSEVKKCRQKDLKMLRAVLLSICWVMKQLSCSISQNIRRYSARFRGIIVK